MLILLLLIFFFYFKGKEAIIFPPVSPSISSRLFLAFGNRTSTRKEGWGEQRRQGTEIRSKQKLDGIHREAFVLFVFFPPFS